MGAEPSGGVQSPDTHTQFSLIIVSICFFIFLLGGGV